MKFSKDTMNKMQKFANSEAHKHLNYNEIKDDFIIYMSDYMCDLMEKGHSEEEALKIAKSNLTSSSETEESEYLKNKYAQYYLSIDPATEETIGLFYGGYILIGAVLGAIVGTVVANMYYSDNLFIAIGVSILLGIILATGFGLLKHASIVNKNRS